MNKEIKLKINTIHNMDCLEGLKLMENEIVDLVITSPPYDNLRDYNGYNFNEKHCISIIEELYRVVKTGGVVVWIVNDETTMASESGTSFKQALEFKKAGFCLYDTMIFAKKNPKPLTHRRYEQEFEYMFIFSKLCPKTFNPIMVPCKNAGKKSSGTEIKRPNGKRIKKSSYKEVKSHKIKGNIWYYSTPNKKNNDHPAVFPLELAIDHIKSWSNPDELILDCFMGSGTSAIAALQEHRNFIGFEISSQYCNDANKKIEAFNTNLK